MITKVNKILKKLEEKIGRKKDWRTKKNKVY